MLKLLMALSVMSPLLGILHASVSCAGGNLSVSTFGPDDFPFEEVVPKDRSRKPSGWQSACVEAKIINIDDPENPLPCRFEVGLPLRTDKEGDLVLAEAKELAARKANVAAHDVISAAKEGDTPGTLCASFKAAYTKRLAETLLGFRLSHTCGDPKVPSLPYKPRR